MMLQGNWNFPTSIHFGPGSVCDLARVCADVGIKRPLLVTDRGAAKLSFTPRIQTMLQDAGIDVYLFSDVASNPTDQNVMNGTKAYRANACDGVVALGGGSGIDAGKAIALMVGQTRPLSDFEDVGDNWRRVVTDRMAPCIAIPTTAGTGSEIGRASVIVDSTRREKKIIFHPGMMPGHVICDPELTLELPPNLTAATGVDAFTHCFEAFCAPGYHPIADGIALRGMQLTAQWLPLAFRDGTNLEARSHMMAAATMGAAAFQKGLGAVHAISHAIGGHYDSHHGLTNAVMLPYVLVANSSALQEKMREVGTAIGLTAPDFDAVLNWLLEFRQDLCIPHDSTSLGVVAQDLDVLAAKSKSDPALAGNPIKLSESALRKIIENSMLGKQRVID